jgi:hypothetical protein
MRILLGDQLGSLAIIRLMVTQVTVNGNNTGPPISVANNDKPLPDKNAHSRSSPVHADSGGIAGRSHLCYYSSASV